MPKSLCIIPARGGSKRIPKKNIKDFHGKPIVAYSIQTALNSGLFDEVMVSTDSTEIKTIAREYGARVPFLRSDKSSSDTASTMKVIREVLNEYSKRGQEFEYICCLYATAPFVKISDLIKGMEMISAGTCDTVMPIVRYSYPIWRGLRQISGERVEMIWSEFLHSRSQELETVFHDAGQWFWIRSNAIHLEPFESKCFGVELNEARVQDIDNESDWQIAEMKYRLCLDKLE